VAAFPPAPLGGFLRALCDTFADFAVQSSLPQGRKGKAAESAEQTLPRLRCPGMPLGGGGRKLKLIIELLRQPCRPPAELGRVPPGHLRT
jgi:hypothetical protein